MITQIIKKGALTTQGSLSFPNFGFFVFNVEIVFYYALLCCPPGANTCCVRVGVEFISTPPLAGLLGRRPRKKRDFASLNKLRPYVRPSFVGF